MVQYWFWLSDNLTSHTVDSKAYEHIIVGLKEWKVVGRKTQKSFFVLFAAISVF